jgi:hypothetical protein
MKISVRTNVLTDKSETFDVVLTTDAGNVVEFPAVDEASAHELADTLGETINRLTTEVCKVWY